MGGAIPFHVAMVIYGVFTYFFSWINIKCGDIEDNKILEWNDYYSDVEFMMVGHGLVVFMFLLKKSLSKKSDV